MFPANQTAGALAVPPGTVPRPEPDRLILRPGHATAWDALHLFLRQLQSLHETVEQVGLLLEAIREGTGADAVFWYPGPTGDVAHLLTDMPLSPQWCRDFGRLLLADTPVGDSQALRSALPALPAEVGKLPRSAALVRVSKSKGIWVIALSFDPERPLHRTDLKLMALAARMFLTQCQHTRVEEKLKETLFGLVRCLTATIDARDPYTGGHSERVARIAVRLSQQMGLSGSIISDLYLAGLLHDIGKVGLRDDVLQKPGKLTPEEFALARQHPVLGDHILSNVKQLAHLRPGVRNHHECYDGTGYPDGLAGENIPLMARILAVADACDAMMAPRPYRSALPPTRIDAILREGAGSQWDPVVVQHFMACRLECYSICRQGLGDSVRVAVEQACQEMTG